MTWFQAPGSRPGQYVTVAASQTTAVLGTTGAVGDYLESLTVFAAGAPGTVALIDGVTTVGTFTPAANSSATVTLRAYSKTGAWKVTTGSAVTVMATGQFS